jgi:hypothetical protein
MTTITETFNVKINLSSVGWKDRYPGARVYVDDQLIFNKIISTAELVDWTGELAAGNHKIVVEMYNKRDGDTVLDSNDNIVNDVVLNVDKIVIDDVDLDLIIWEKSTYYPDGEYSPDSVEECVNLGWNGRWELPFNVPTYLWLLENL